MAFVALWIVAALFNLLAIPLARAMGDDPPIIFLWAGMLIGILPGQVGALALWVVWGDGSFLRRLAIHWGVGSVLWLCLMTGLVLAMSDMPPPDGWHEVGITFCLLPLASLAAQTPLWPLRTYLGWRVERHASRGGDPAQRSLSIGDILLGTAVTAVTLALVRMIPGRPSEVWGSAVITALSVMVVSCISLLPAVAIMLRVEEQAAGIMMLAGYTLAVGVILLAGLAGISRGSLPATAAFSFFIALYSFAATLIAPLVVLRSHGYRLTWPRDRRIKSEPSE